VTSLSAQAEQRWFEVELLMFQRNVDIQNITEHLSSEQIQIDTSNSINLLKASPAPGCLDQQGCFSSSNPTVIGSAQFNAPGFKRLGSSRLQLTTQRKNLERHASFEPLLHMAWRMPVARGTSAKPLHIFAGKNLASYMQQPVINQQVAELQGNNDLIVDTEGSVVDDNIGQIVQPAQAQILAEDKWAIDGNFKIYLDHYLYIDSQLIIRKAITETIQETAQAVELIDDDNGVQIAKLDETTSQSNDVSQQTIIKEVLFDQSRRLRSEEIHYLDHPLMGIIVQIRKIPTAEVAFTQEQLVDPEELLATEPLSEDGQSLGTEQSTQPAQLPVSELSPEPKPLTSDTQSPVST